MLNDIVDQIERTERKKLCRYTRKPTKNTVVFLTLPAPVYVEPPSLCLFFSFCSIELSLREDKVEMVLLVVVLWRMS